MCRVVSIPILSVLVDAIIETIFALNTIPLAHYISIKYAHLKEMRPHGHMISFGCEFPRCWQSISKIGIWQKEVGSEI